MTDMQRILSAPDPASREGWVPLPGFTFAIPAVGLNDEMIRFFTSSMLKLYAVATVRELAPLKDELQFVVLCKVDNRDGSLSIRSHAPFPKLISFIGAQLPPRSSGQNVRTLIEGLGIPVKQRCALPFSVWVPVVVAYNSAEPSFLLTNLNQLQSPEQFENPYSCRTTSGFLNFIGTFLCKHQQTDEQVLMQVDNIEALVGKGLDPWIRWVHEFAESGIAFDSDRVFVNERNPEEYDYRYG